MWWLLQVMTLSCRWFGHEYSNRLSASKYTNSSTFKGINSGSLWFISSFSILPSFLGRLCITFPLLGTLLFGICLIFTCQSCLDKSVCCILVQLHICCGNSCQYAYIHGLSTICRAYLWVPAVFLPLSLSCQCTFSLVPKSADIQKNVRYSRICRSFDWSLTNSLKTAWFCGSFPWVLKYTITTIVNTQRSRNFGSTRYRRISCRSWMSRVRGIELSR